MPDETKTYYHTTPNGSRIFVEECGSGPLMVLMHGLGGTTNAFQPLISHFSSRYTMLRFDFPGSGFSTFKSPPSIPQFVEDLSSVLDSKSSKESPVLVGHSLGSIVAMQHASKNPGVSGLVLIGPGRSASHIPAVVERMTGLGAKARLGIEGIRDSTITNNVAPSSSDLVRTIVRQMISSQDAEGYAATCEAVCAKTHVDPDYSTIKCPTVLIAGDQDSISPMSRSEDLKTLIGGGGNEKVLLKVVHSGHQQVLEDTAGIVKAMEAMLAFL
ncbi:Pimeloyl-[acyl-carrier protein] methyl ester esterase [Lachnellula willkommii]|uniref:Pimeloyl-[acyl-carrier protein] methyl ester esterase n=1 Tax=Lachnellula willkommii TaxID=215461 RepID=A0A559MKY0_9HELO|nr:Pimeloyl-[acyl-carrier protein] methyl ester esterase [Lachnellula willkommii]